MLTSAQRAAGRAAWEAVRLAYVAEQIDPAPAGEVKGALGGLEAHDLDQQKLGIPAAGTGAGAFLESVEEVDLMPV